MGKKIRVNLTMDEDVWDELLKYIDCSRSSWFEQQARKQIERHDEDGKFLGFSKGQTSEQTKMIVSDTNPLIKFLMEEYMEDKQKHEMISNARLCENYKNYCLRNNITFDSKNINANHFR